MTKTKTLCLISGLVLLALAPAARADSATDLTGSDAPPSTRSARPLTISAALAGAVPGLGLELSYQLADRFAVAAQATTVLAHTDLSLRTRAFLLALPRWGLYAGLNARIWHSPILFNGLRPVVDAEIGYEWRGLTGWTFGVGAGAGALRAPCCEGQPAQPEIWMPVVMTNLRFGKSF